LSIFPFSRFEVSDNSMEPFLRQDDHVVTFNWSKPKKNEVIVFTSDGKYFVKRVDRILKNQFFVSGDNRQMSSKLDPIGRKQIVGKVIIKY